MIKSICVNLSDLRSVCGKSSSNRLLQYVYMYICKYCYTYFRITMSFIKNLNIYKIDIAFWGSGNPNFNRHPRSKKYTFS